MKTIPIVFLIQFCRVKTLNELDELINQIHHEELLNIRESYCWSVKSNEDSDFCQTEKDGFPPGFLLLILSIIRECFHKHIYTRLFSKFWLPSSTAD